jgi:ribose transport system ATP-binding protein
MVSRTQASSPAASDDAMREASAVSGSGFAVVVEGVSKSFGETRALSDCSFRARPGEIHAVVGENGSGKSTLAKILSGVIAADSGSVEVLGATPLSPAQARKIGVATIFQEVLVANDASVIDNLFVGSDGFFGSTISRSQRRQIAAELLQRLTLTEIDPSGLVGDLPLNLKQWIVIGRALLIEPKVLILDESSAALDLDATNRLHGEMRKLRDSGACVIIVTHRIAELVRIADHATILRDGRVTGELARHEINERNLLELMTPANRLQRRAAAEHVKTAPGASRRRLMSIKGLRVNALGDAFDLAVASGEIIGVAGLDGQGQDNFVRLLSGIGFSFGGKVEVIKADGGTERLNVFADAIRLGVSYVSGDRKREGIFPNLSIFENLAIALYRANRGPLGWLSRGPVAAAYETEVRRFSIKTGDLLNKITSLSGGNQQKILIGRAFASAPSLIVLNDPARGVDLGTKIDLYDELRRYAASGGAVVYLSSEIEEFLGFADRVAVFHRGGLFRVLEGEDVAEDAMLAAMFGHHEPVAFDAPETDVAR